MKKVFVTGANGVLAVNTIIELIAKNYAVVALVRDKNRFLLKEEKNIELIEGDICNYSLLESVTSGCDYIIHAAAQTKQGLSKYSDYTKTNITGTSNLLNAALKNKIKRFVYVSTSNVFGFGSIRTPGNETTKIKEPFASSFYVRSKIEAQKVVLSYSDRMDVVAVNPTFLIGAYDQKPSSGRIIQLGYNKRVLFCPPGGKNFVDVKDVAKGTVNALSKGKNKETYILSGNNLNYREFFTKLSNYSEQKSILLRIPKIVLLTAGIFGNIIKSFGIDTEISLTNMRILCIENFYTSKKAENELDLKFNTIDDAIKDAVKWFKQHNMIK